MQGNYYEVIYCSLKKLTAEKNIEITKLVFECLLQLLQVLPSDPQVPFFKYFSNINKEREHS